MTLWGLSSVVIPLWSFFWAAVWLMKVTHGQYISMDSLDNHVEVESQLGFLQHLPAAHTPAQALLNVDTQEVEVGNLLLIVPFEW